MKLLAAIFLALSLSSSAATLVHLDQVVTLPGVRGTGYVWAGNKPEGMYIWLNDTHWANAYVVQNGIIAAILTRNTGGRFGPGSVRFHSLVKLERGRPAEVIATPYKYRIGGTAPRLVSFRSEAFVPL